MNENRFGRKYTCNWPKSAVKKVVSPIHQGNQRMFDPFESKLWKLGHGRELELGPSSVIMGILNVTPDSFSDGGKYIGVDQAVKRSEIMIGEGAQIIDIGGESTRPGSEPVTAEEEQARVLPVIEALSANTDVLISIDTYRASTAALAVSAGAHIVNDVWGCQREPEIAKVAADNLSGLCAMHTGRERNKEADVVKDQFVFFEKTLGICRQAGVDDRRIVLDPGFGFAKDVEENVSLLARLEALHELQFPLLIGTSRKRFVGALTGNDVEDRGVGTAATSVVARMKGGAIFRVHDVAANREALSVTDAVLAAMAEADHGK